MGKKLKELAGSVTENQLASTVKESAQQIWLAGLGAFAKAQEEGGKVVDALKSRGIDAPVADIVPCAPASRRRAVFSARRTERGAVLGYNRAFSGAVTVTPISPATTWPSTSSPRIRRCHCSVPAGASSTLPNRSCRQGLPGADSSSISISVRRSDFTRKTQVDAGKRGAARSS